MRFEEAAQSYDDYACVQREVADWCAEWIPRAEHPWSQRRTVLELGAGTGLMTQHLVREGGLDVVATDASPAMLRRGAERVPQAKWQALDAWNPIAPARDLLVATSLLQWAKEPVEVLRRWRSLVRPGGRLLLSCFVQGTLRELLHSSPTFSALSWHTPEAWLGHLESAGWAVLRSSTWSTLQHFPSGARALRSVHRTGAVLPRRTSPTELRRALRSYEAQFGDETGAVPLSWHALRVEAAISAPATRED